VTIAFADMTCQRCGKSFGGPVEIERENHIACKCGTIVVVGPLVMQPALSPDDEALGRHLREWLRELGITLRKACELFDLNGVQMSDLLAGRRRVTEREVSKLIGKHEELAWWLDDRMNKLPKLAEVEP